MRRWILSTVFLACGVSCGGARHVTVNQSSSSSGHRDDVRWVRLRVSDQLWEVSATYIAPVALDEAARLAREYDADLPTPELVDAIWHEADLKLAPQPRSHDGTAQAMASEHVYQEQQIRIDQQVNGRAFRLLAGSHKDVVRDPATGRLGLYGWHQPNGVVIQPLYTGHRHDWIDYSQGLRLCRRVLAK